MEVKRIFDILELYKTKFSEKKVALAGKEDGNWINYSSSDYIEKSNAVSYGLLQLGIKKGDAIASISYNRPEWNFIDMGIQQIGAIHIPIYPTISQDDYKFILNHAEIKIVFTAGEEMFKKIKDIIPDIPAIKWIYTFKNIHEHEHLNELMDLGRKNVNIQKLQECKDAISENNISTIIYTSGTTGNPKGVMLTHNNIITNFIACTDILPYRQEGIVVSFLPLCHVYERMMNYLYQYNGLSIYYAQNFATISENMLEIGPHLITTVPLLLEKIFAKIMLKGGKLTGIKRAIFDYAIHLGMHYELNGANGWWYEFKLALARKLVFKKWKEALGGRLDVIVSGGAALQPQLARIFWAAGFRVMEGYGLTETSPVIALNNFDPGGIKFGTVGLPIKTVELKIAPDGEIICRGPSNMLGYYKDEKMTKEMIDSEGWLHTGDMGAIVDDKYLKITGRKKEIFKTSNGKYIAPMPIENKFKESAFVENMLVVGENQKFAGALIVPNFEHLKCWFETKGHIYTNNAEVINHPDVKKKYSQEVNHYNSSLGSTEQVKKYILINQEWTIDGGELSAAMKVKRSHLLKKYNKEIENMFA